MTIKELIKHLNKYDENTEVCSGVIDNNCMSHFDLIIKESHPIGDRDMEEELLLWIGFEDNKTYDMPTEEERKETFKIFGIY